MDSDADSEDDRRAYGQYASLDLYGEDVDADAAAYLRSVRYTKNSLSCISLTSEPDAQ